MKKTRPVRWYHRLFYRWSSPYRHDVDKGYRWYKALGYTEGYNDCLNHMPWPFEPQTDPLQPVQVQTAVIQQPRGAFFQQVIHQPGHNTESQILKALPKLQGTGAQQLAQLKARMHEKEGQK